MYVIHVMFEGEWVGGGVVKVQGGGTRIMGRGSLGDLRVFERKVGS